MQGSAPPHHGLTVRGWLTENLPGRWMGRASPNLPWPSRSPDLAPCHFFLRGFIISKVYSTKSSTVEEIKGKIKRAFEEEISSDMSRNVMESYVKRLQECLQKNGNQVQSSIWIYICVVHFVPYQVKIDIFYNIMVKFELSKLKNQCFITLCNVWPVAGTPVFSMFIR